MTRENQMNEFSGFRREGPVGPQPHPLVADCPRPLLSESSSDGDCPAHEGCDSFHPHFTENVSHSRSTGQESEKGERGRVGGWCCEGWPLFS